MDAKSKAKSILSELFPFAQVKATSFNGHLQSSLLEFSVCVEVKTKANRIGFELFSLKSPSVPTLGDALALIKATPTLPDGASVLLLPRATAAATEYLRKRQVSYVDCLGNAWIDLPGLYVNRQGATQRQARKRSRIGVFSDKATLVLRVLLETNGIGVRAIAEKARERGFTLSPGYVSKTLSELDRLGYLTRKDNSFKLQEVKGLLEEWALAYRQLNGVRREGYFIAAVDATVLLSELTSELNLNKARYLLTGLAGAYHVDRYATFDSIDLYVQDTNRMAALLGGLGARKVERGANITVHEPRYPVSAWYGGQEVDGTWAASDLQLYLDLQHEPHRGLEQSEHLLKRLVPDEGGANHAS
jgi:hypothetical protein